MDTQYHDHAGVLERGIAWFLDGLVLFVILLGVLIPLIVLMSPQSEAAAEGLGALVGFFGNALYLVITEAKWGATPGKKMMGIRVVDMRGDQCGADGAVVRNITKVLGGSAFLPVIVAIVLIWSSEDNQRLGDMMGETMVVRD